MNEELDLQERGAPDREGKFQTSQKRLFMQLLVFGGCTHTDEVIADIKKVGLKAVLYLDANDPKGIGVLFLSEEADAIVEGFRNLIKCDSFLSLQQKQEYTMFGRTYALGHERDLEDWLLQRPYRVLSTDEARWNVWYPLRRSGDFELLTRAEQGKILAEHGLIGRKYGQAGLAQDIRLACHGLDKNDNEFIIGLVGGDLYPLSKIVQDMRSTQQTAKYIQSMGPFFVGKLIWRSF